MEPAAKGDQKAAVSYSDFSHCDFDAIALTAKLILPQNRVGFYHSPSAKTDDESRVSSAYAFRPTACPLPCRPALHAARAIAGRYGRHTPAAAASDADGGDGRGRFEAGILFSGHHPGRGGAGSAGS